MALKIVFAGTPKFAAKHLDALNESDHEIVGVYTQPDRPAGRGKQLQASAVKKLAQSASLDIFQPETLKTTDAQIALKKHNVDVMVVVAYGLLLPQAVLDIPRLGCINVHGSILPRWRGAAPIQRAIEAGDTQTGITIMQMDKGLDTGDMLFKTVCDITPQDTATHLHDKLAELGPIALIEALNRLERNELLADKQDNNLATYANKLSKAEGLINWQSYAAQLDLKVRAFNPYPIAHTLLKGERLRVIEAHPIASEANAKPGTITQAEAKGLVVQCGDDSALSITQLQLPGKKVMAVSDALNGFGERLAVGTVLG